MVGYHSEHSMEDCEGRQGDVTEKKQAKTSTANTGIWRKTFALCNHEFPHLESGYIELPPQGVVKIK